MEIAAALEVAHSAVTLLGPLLNNLAQYAKYNVDLISGVHENVRNLPDELKELNKFVKECSEEYDDNDDLADLANKIRVVVNQAEDAIETYFVEMQRHKLKNPVVRAFQHNKELRKIAKDIEGITAKMSQLRQTKIPRGVEIMEGKKIANADEKEEEKQTFDEDDDVVGMEDEANKFIGLLTEGTKDLEVISIIGMLGLGKTTLARKVFKHPIIEYQFFIRAFVQVSQEYTRKEVFQKILATFTDVTGQMNEMEDKELAKMIREYLQNRQYLIVLDDVWDPEDWDTLQIAFPKNKKGSRILITSRNEPVALAANKNSDPHILRFLRPEEAKELLRKKVFGMKIPPDFVKDYEEEILKKCNGLPLAIVVVAGILLNNRDKPYWWEKVSEGVADYDPKSKEKTDKVIKLSYNHLPDRLKPCFLYLGVFREDIEIPARTLFQLWVSEGFIEDKGDRCLEDVAEGYLEELVGRSIVMVGKRRPNGHIKTCRIHDTLRDFCKDKAEKENLFREIKRYEQVTNSFRSFITDNDRRRCINSNVEQYIKLKPTGERVRSFLSFANEEITLALEDIQSILAEFKLLRVLDIRSVNFIRFPLDLYGLLLLKYVAISGDLKILPQKMSNLCNLQTLIVRTSSPTLEIKWDIWKMPQLRHLHSNSCTTLAEVKEKSPPNNNLQTLSTISPESCTKEVFGRSRNLKKLGIKGRLAEYFQAKGQCSLFASCQELLLENLKLLNDDSSKLKALPDHKNFPRNLKRLTLSNTLLDWEHMWTLGKLEKLEELKLEDNAFLGKSWGTKDGGFLRLKVFLIGKTDLVFWEASRTNFPVLTHLYLKHCDRLTSIPPDFVYIPSLQMIDLYCTSPKVASSAKDIQLTKLKVQAQERSNRITPFKLSVYPPDHVSSETTGKAR